MYQINRLSLYLINSIKFRRLVLGISAYQFALNLKKSRNYISQIENTDNERQYNSADYPLIAKALNCELSDIIPPDDWILSDSHEKVDKKVVSLTDAVFVREVIEGINASPKTDVLKDINSLLKHLALTSKNPEEIIVVTKVWKEFF